ncbi:MAG: ABC transporter ATP-binding protein [Thermomicrobiales bacterium]|nr:ABC transporter ATP-binding protein [Thermomicrobiales bacterium]MCO5220127.1 ABC transporter ATP-binding protein [Thermomicrobiales bacterium]
MAEIKPQYSIQAVDIHKTYDTGTAKVPALKGVNLEIAPGEMVAVMGPSGCGKTTLLNCLSGLDKVDSGEIWLEGKNLATLSDRERTQYRALRMGFVFQVYNLLPVLNAVENVELPLLLAGVKPRAAREQALGALDQVGLRDWARHRPAELSGGQRQRTTIARALVNRPAIVWADEPTGALDSSTADEIMGLMRALNEQEGLTIVLVTHDAHVGAQCGRLISMMDGQIIGDDAQVAEVPQLAGV